MISKKIVTAVAAITLSSTVLADCGKVEIADMNWQSAEFLAGLDKEILTRGFGCQVELVPGSTSATTASMTEKGTPDISAETYTRAAKPAIMAAVAEGRLEITNQTPLENVAEAWYIPTEFAEKHNLRTLQDVLARPDLFPHPEDPSKGGFVTCPSGWSCQTANTNLFRAFNMEELGWKQVIPGNGAGIAALITKHMERKEPIFVWYWTPTTVLSRYEMTALDWGVPYDDDMFSNCISVEGCENPKPTAWPEVEAVTLSTARLPAEVKGYLANRSLKASVYNKYLTMMDDAQLTGEEVAEQFIANEYEVLVQYVGEETAKKIQASLK